MKKEIFLAGAIAVALGLTAVAAGAEGRGGPDRERASFSQLDADQSGEVTMAEMTAFAEARFAANDTDGDGSLSVEELIAARTPQNEERMERRISRFIERADDNGNGMLELGEIGPSEERMQARFERIDTDGSGGLSQAEMDAARDDRRAKRDGDDG